MNLKQYFIKFLSTVYGKHILNNIITTTGYELQSTFEMFSTWQAFNDMRGEMFSERCILMYKL
jgi:hypothetical protein